MTTLFKTPYTFRGRRYRSALDISSAFLPDGINEVEYLKAVNARLSTKRISGESDFIKAIRPSGCFFFGNYFFDSVSSFLTKYGLPKKLEPYVSELIGDNPIDTEKSLIMLLQEFKRGVLTRKLSQARTVVSARVFGKLFDDITQIRKHIPYIKFTNLEEVDDVEAYVLDALNRYFYSHPVQLGIVHLSSFSEMVTYTRLSSWDLIYRLKRMRNASSPHEAIFTTTNSSSSPVVVQGEMFTHLHDAIRSYSVDWSKAMSKLLGNEVCTPDTINKLFTAEELVGSNPVDLVKFEGSTMTLAQLLKLIGGRSSIFLSRMKEVEPNYQFMTLQQIIDKHLLKANHSKTIS